MGGFGMCAYYAALPQFHQGKYAALPQHVAPALEQPD
jgi:hypothetical protein